MTTKRKPPATKVTKAKATKPKAANVRALPRRRVSDVVTVAEVYAPRERSYLLTMGDRGRVVLPAPLRNELHLEPGDQLLARVTSAGSLSMESFGARARRLRGSFAHAGTSMADELLAERAREAEDDA